MAALLPTAGSSWLGVGGSLLHTYEEVGGGDNFTAMSWAAPLHSALAATSSSQSMSLFLHRQELLSGTPEQAGPWAGLPGPKGDWEGRDGGRTKGSKLWSKGTGLVSEPELPGSHSWQEAQARAGLLGFVTEKLPPGPCSGWEGAGKVRVVGLHGPVGYVEACGGREAQKSCFLPLGIWVRFADTVRKGSSNYPDLAMAQPGPREAGLPPVLRRLLSLLPW